MRRNRRRLQLIGLPAVLAGAMCTLGFCYEHGYGVHKELVQAVYWYRQAAEKGHPGAQNNLGLRYLSGEGVEVDHDLVGRVCISYAVLRRSSPSPASAIVYQAFKYFYQSAELGDDNALCSLGYCYQMLIGTTESHLGPPAYLRSACLGNR